MTVATARYRGQVSLDEMPDPMTITEAARVVGVAEALMYREAREGRLYARRIGRRLLVPKAGFVRWLDGTEDEVDQRPGPPLAVVKEAGRTA